MIGDIFIFYKNSLQKNWQKLGKNLQNLTYSSQNPIYFTI